MDGLMRHGKSIAKKPWRRCRIVEIDWDNKVMELDGKTIDCVWNGMTLIDEVTSAMACTAAYCNNAQVALFLLIKQISIRTKTV